MLALIHAFYTLTYTLTLTCFASDLPTTPKQAIHRLGCLPFRIIKNMGVEVLGDANV